jgi:predicted MFS family arabinose efflux permease
VLGGSMSLLAVPWFVYETTGDPLRTGVVALCETLPLVACSFLAGAVVQRIGARRTRVWSDVVSGATVVAIPVLHATTGIPFWLLLVLVAVNGAVRAPAPAASLVLLAVASAARGASTDATIGAYAATLRVATTAGAPLSGLLIAVLGAPSVLLVDAATFLASAALVQALVPAETTARGAAAAHLPAGTRVGVGAGFAVLRQDRTLALLSTAVVVVAVVEAGWASVLAPVYGTEVLSSALVLGVLFGVLGAGATAGSLLHPWLAARWPAQPLLVAAVLLAGAPRFAVLAAAPPLGWLLLVVFVSGLALGVLGPLWLGVQYERVPRGRQSHVFGVTFGLEQGGVALGALGGGLLLRAVPVTSALLVLAGVGLTVAGALALTRPLQQGPAPA